MDYAAHYDRLICRARERIPNGYTEFHHIVPKCIGGGNETENIVKLYPEEHYVAHQLLVRIYPGVTGLVWAATMMSSHPSKRRSNKLYGWLRRRLSVIAKQRVGDRNGSYGTRWVTCVDNGDSMKIKAADPIPDGWVAGRVMEKVELQYKLKQQRCLVCSVPCGNHKYCEQHAREKRAAQCKQNGTAVAKRGNRYVNNGSIQKVIKPGENIPCGFVLGRIKQSKKMNAPVV